MTCVTIALLEKVDDKLKRKLDGSKVLVDHLILEAGKEKYLLAITGEKTDFEGVKPVQLAFEERPSEELVAVLSVKEVDYSLPAYRIYADPLNTESLVTDGRIGDGFIIKAGKVFDTPEDSLKLLRALKAGARIDGVYKKGGEPSAAMNNRVLLARCGPYHPTVDEILRPFKAKPKKAVDARLVCFSLRNGRMTVDNTYKPKTVKIGVK